MGKQGQVSLATSERAENPCGARTGTRYRNGPEREQRQRTPPGTQKRRERSHVGGRDR